MCDLEEFELVEYLRYREAVTERARQAARADTGVGTPTCGTTGPATANATA